MPAHRQKSAARNPVRKSFTAGVALAAAALLAPASVSAFCGFYVSGADASLYANATMVVMMREGRRTVLSMQNNYQGPPQDFAMVVPVPAVLSEDNVRTLDKAIFERVDQLAAPRLVEYWEHDPCAPQVEYDMALPSAAPRGARLRSATEGSGGLGVTVEAEFTVGEYDIVILSAEDSSGLDTWLRREQYNIPSGAEAVLRPYVEQGTKFFVAKVDSSKVTFQNGAAVLSPLRVHYDSAEFSLPVRLGLLNSQGQQDLIVHILARGQRYEVANYNNSTIATNLRVKDDVRAQFAGFYDLLFRRSAGGAPRTVVTEYAWDASSCDPCPVPALSPQEIVTLGGDVIGQSSPGPAAGGPAAGVAVRRPPPPRPPFRGGFVLTRLHYRYGQHGLNEDLVFRAAPPIVGGRGIPDAQGTLRERGAQPGSINNFQGRYVMLNRWDSPLTCANPVRGRWGGPPGSGRWQDAPPRTTAPSNPAMDLVAGDTPTEVASLGPLLDESVPALGITAGAAEAPLPHDPGPIGGAHESNGPASNPQGVAPGEVGEGGCASCQATAGPAPWTGMWLLALAAGFLSRRRIRL